MKQCNSTSSEGSHTLYELETLNKYIMLTNLVFDDDDFTVAVGNVPRCEDMMSEVSTLSTQVCTLNTVRLDGKGLDGMVHVCGHQIEQHELYWCSYYQGINATYCRSISLKLAPHSMYLDLN